jgi:antitoxin CptB
MGTFADQHLANASSEDLSLFEALLDQADWDVYYWIVGQVPVPEKYQGPVMERLQAMSFTVETIRRTS